MHARLAAVDAAAAGRIHPNDAQRIQRALEVHAASGRPISELQTVTAPSLDREFLVTALIPADRARLHAALAQRFENHDGGRTARGGSHVICARRSDR